jgi:predicted ATPase
VRRRARSRVRALPSRAAGRCEVLLGVWQRRGIAFSLVRGAHVLWYLGYPEQALRRMQEGISAARETRNPFVLATALNCSMWLDQYRREAAQTQESAEAVITIAVDYGFPMWRTIAAILRGWALVSQRHAGREATAEMREVLEARRKDGANIVVPYFYGLLAEACGEIGEVECGIAAAREGLAVAKRTGEAFWTAELHRLSGELVACSPVTRTEAERCFRHAIGIARSQPSCARREA